MEKYITLAVIIGLIVSAIAAINFIRTHREKKLEKEANSESPAEEELLPKKYTIVRSITIICADKTLTYKSENDFGLSIVCVQKESQLRTDIKQNLSYEEEGSDDGPEYWKLLGRFINWSIVEFVREQVIVTPKTLLLTIPYGSSEARIVDGEDRQSFTATYVINGHDMPQNLTLPLPKGKWKIESSIYEVLELGEKVVLTEIG